MSHKTALIIPARYAATRFPGKLLKDLCGISVLQRTWLAACQSGAEIVAIAVDHPTIAEHAKSFGAQVIHTGECQSGSDRVFMASEQLNLDENDLIINLQGDEPLFHPHNIRLLIDAMQKHPQWHIGSMMHPITDNRLLDDPSAVKVVTSVSNIAMYFSRCPIPFARNHTNYQLMLHQGIYAYRQHALEKMVALPDCALEQREQLEQLRVLFHDMQIHMVISKYVAHPGIDTPQDLANAIHILSQEDRASI